MQTHTREDLFSVLNNSGLSGNITKLHNGLVSKAMALLNIATEEQKTPLSEDEALKQANRNLLNAVGPAAADAAVNYAIKRVQNRASFSGTSFNGSFVNNVLIAEKNPGYKVFSTNLREYLLPRYSYVNFDAMVDSRHMIDQECGYPASITPLMYRYMYDRDDIARRVVDIYPDESWAVNPEPYDVEDEDKISPWEQEWLQLCTDYQILQMCYRWDKLMGIGSFGGLLIQLEGETDLEKPIAEPELLAGKPRSISTKQRELLYVRPFDEYQLFVQDIETNPNHRRCGKPTYYNVTVADVSATSGTGTPVGTKTTQRVHWTRICHAAESMESSLVYGTPRQKPVFNRLLDLRKIKGASSEMFWKGGFPGISFEVNPQYLADNPEFDEEMLREQVRKLTGGLQRYFLGLGVSAKTLQVAIADPRNHIYVQMQAIAAHFGIPLRIFVGSEEGKLASGQDRATWNNRLRRRLRTTVETEILRNLIDRFIAIGVMRPPNNNKYAIAWPDLNAPSDEDRANLSLKWTQALSQYVSTGVIHLIPPMDYLTVILGLQPAKAMNIIKTVEGKGGWAKLMKVDPSQTKAPTNALSTTKKSRNNGDQARKKNRSASKGK